jgi:hypothetical protein
MRLSADLGAPIRLHDAHLLGRVAARQLNASSVEPDSHVSKSSGFEISTGMRSWLMLCVSAFGSVVMKANTSWSTFSPFFLSGPR